jgi:hypothetical protein
MKLLLRIAGFAALIAAMVGTLLYLTREQATDGGRPALVYGLRTLVIGLALTGWYWSQALIGSRRLKDGVITDGFHELSAPLHRYLLTHPRSANALLIGSSLFIDCFGLFLIGISILGPTMRPFVAMLIVFAMRQACQGMCALPAPRDMIWRHPGFPSLLVTYSVGTDFFFSGHTSIAMLGAIEIVRVAPGWLGAAACAVAVMEAVTVLVLRAHYTMDIVGAVCATWCAVALAGLLCGIF